MKFLLSLFCILSFSQNGLAARALDVARETDSIKVEYYQTSNSGLVRVKGCNQCTKEMYTFTKKPLITRSGQAIPFEEFMQEYWQAEYPTLLLDIETLSVLSIHY